MNNKAINEFGVRRVGIKNYADLSRRVDNTLLDLHNSFYYSFKIFPRF